MGLRFFLQTIAFRQWISGFRAGDQIAESGCWSDFSDFRLPTSVNPDNTTRYGKLNIKTSLSLQYLRTLLLLQGSARVGAASYEL
jgi:hypothetical protein